MRKILLTLFYILTFNFAFAGQNNSNNIKATDIIDKSSTASHINPEDWKERNPQHIISDDIFSVMATQINEKYESPKTDSDIGKIVVDKDYEKYEKAVQRIITYNNELEIKDRQRIAQMNQQHTTQTMSEQQQNDETDNIVEGLFIDMIVKPSVGNTVSNILSTKSNTGGNHYSQKTNKKKTSTSKNPNCKAECKSNGCEWQGEYFTDPKTGLKGCICGC